MVHLVARALDGTLLFHTHAEARALFDRIAAAFPDALAFCLMPDHVHLVVPANAAARLRYVLAGYARWRNAHRGESGGVWRAAPEPEPIPDPKHLRRTVRYVHLNPCRAAIVTDPLAWQWSTHRDAVGFALPAVRSREHEPARFHRWVSGDPTVDVEGTALPEGSFGTVRWDEVANAVAGVCRVAAGALTVRGRPRTLALQTAWLLEAASPAALAAAAGLDRTGVYRVCAEVPARGLVHRHPDLHTCVRAVGDPRFGALPEGDLRGRAGWERYRHRR